MKITKPKVPEGWRVLKRGTMLIEGDRFIYTVETRDPRKINTWNRTSNPGIKIGRKTGRLIYIRSRQARKSP